MGATLENPCRLKRPDGRPSSRLQPPTGAKKRAPHMFAIQMAERREAQTSGLACPVCGRVCRSAIGLMSHAKTHKPAVDPMLIKRIQAIEVIVGGMILEEEAKRDKGGA